MSSAIDFTSYSPLPARSRERFARPRIVATPQGERVRSADGRELSLREIEPGDVAALQRMFHRLSPQDVRRRFMHAMSELPAAMAQRLCRIDPAVEAAFVLMDETVKPAEIRGVGRIFIDEARNNAEFSVLVETAWTGNGLGALLMQQLVAEARRRGLCDIWGYVLMENRPMLQMCRELGFVATPVPGEPGMAQISLQL